MNAMLALCLILIVTTILGQISARLNFPTVLGYLVSGIILGPAGLHWLQTTDLIQIFSEIGVVILMFIAGLESNLSNIRRFWRPSVYVAVIGMIIPIATAYLTGRYFHFSQLKSIFLGVTFAATSVSISIVVLQEMHQLDSNEGATILGAAVVDDILAVVVLSLLISFSGNHVQNNDSHNLLITSSLQLGYLILLVIVGRWLIPRLMTISSKLLVANAETIIALIICFSLASLADLVGLSSVIGAFFAGLMLSQTHYKKLIHRDTQPIGNAIFIPVFFISIGLKLSLQGILNDFGLFLTLSFGGIGAKMIGASLGARLTQFSWRSSWMIGAGMISRGEMALIIAQLGLKSHLLSSNSYSAVIGAIIVTTLLAPFILKQTISYNSN